MNSEVPLIPRGRMKIGSLALKLLQSVGEPIPVEPNDEILRNVDWNSLGVTHPYIIFMTGRCGSTWLTSILKKTGLAGNPEEFFNGDVANRERRGTAGFSDYFSSVVRRQASNGRFGVEVDAARLRELDSLVSWRTVFPVEKAASFFLYRRNIVAQAWSWASAAKSGFWHSRVGAVQPVQVATAVGSSVPTEAELIRALIKIRQGEEFLEDFFSRNHYQPYYVDYETLMSELATEVMIILSKLGIDDEVLMAMPALQDDVFAKIEYSTKHHVLSKFALKHHVALDLLRCNRFGLDSSALSDLLSKPE